MFRLPPHRSIARPDRTRNGYFLRWEREGIVQVVRALVSLATPGFDLHLHPHGAAGPIAAEVEPVRHRIEAYGYRVTEPDGRILLPDRLATAGISGSDVGRLQREGRLGAVRLEDVSMRRPGRRFAFVMDTAVCDGACALADGADLLVAFSDDDAPLAGHYLHLTAGQAGAHAAAGDSGTLVLTHFSSQYDDVDLLAAQARVTAGETPVIAASDLDRIPFPRRRARTSVQSGGTSGTLSVEWGSRSAVSGACQRQGGIFVFALAFEPASASITALSRHVPTRYPC